MSLGMLWRRRSSSSRTAAQTETVLAPVRFWTIIIMPSRPMVFTNWVISSKESETSATSLRRRMEPFCRTMGISMIWVGSMYSPKTRMVYSTVPSLRVPAGSVMFSSSMAFSMSLRVRP